MKYLLFIILPIFFISCQKKNNLESVIKQYNMKVNSYDKIEYDVTRIDTFSRDFSMDRNGTILIEKNIQDTLFNMSFYGQSSSVPTKYLYDNGRQYEISIEDNVYETKKGSYGFLGSPGGQLVSRVFFGLDSVYKSANLTETKNKFILEFSYVNDTLLNIENIKKILEIDKQTFLPIEMIMTSDKLGNKRTEYYKFKNIKVNNDVSNSIDNYKNKLHKLELIVKEEPVRNTQIGKTFQDLKLNEIIGNVQININNKFPALISFWETWCSPCIRSLTKLDSLQNKYSNSLNVIGITTENKEEVVKLLQKKKIKYLNLKASESLLNRFEINSFPTYFLLNENGEIIEEYTQISEIIDEDINFILRK